VIRVHVRGDALEVRPEAELDHFDLGQLGENPVMPRLAGDSLAVVRAECNALLVHLATIPAREPSTYTETMEISPSTVELLTWVTARERSYEDVVDAWRSNCPRHAVWDDAVTAGLVTAARAGVALTERGRAALAASG
jgi:D-3-phosphoglycerate dehydrogenase